MTTKSGGSYRTIVVCVDSQEANIPSGRFYNPYLCQGIAFKGLTQFVKKMEQSLDLMEEIDRLCEPREDLFAEAGYFPMCRCHTGQKATFAVRILFRQNGSWQGCCTWLEQKQNYSFKSALEFVLLLSEALEIKEAG